MNKQKSIEQQLEQALLAGRWKLFDRLPAERVLAEEFAVNRGTLRAALAALAGRGILDTIHGSGTRVKAMPSDHPSQSPLAERLSAGLLLVPPIMHTCSLIIRPSQIISLERILPVAGAALRNNDMKVFAQAQRSFFMDAVHCIDNRCVSAAVAVCLPEGRQLVRLFSVCNLQENETLFAHLASILSSMRHADAEEAAAAAQAYFSTLQTLAEKA